MRLTNHNEDSPLNSILQGFHWLIGEPFFCLAAVASSSQQQPAASRFSFLVIWHFVPAVSEILLRRQKADLLRPSFLPSIASNLIPKASFLHY